MKWLLLLPVLALAASVHAVDTPGSNPSLPSPSVQDRLAKARQAVASQDWRGAMRELDVAVRQAPENADVHNLLGYTYRKRATPDLAKAFDHYRLALKFDPGHKGAHEYIGEAYLMERRLPEAEQHLAALERLCGNRECEEYRDLARAITDYKAKN
ncbi:MAG TPA: tetratricopeptide repeat protein [Ramlibacter sp.]|nr:tetratricopeptide repeat protein [Ramlibacter sp.]